MKKTCKILNGKHQTKTKKNLIFISCRVFSHLFYLMQQKVWKLICHFGYQFVIKTERNQTKLTYTKKNESLEICDFYIK